MIQNDARRPKITRAPSVRGIGLSIDRWLERDNEIGEAESIGITAGQGGAPGAVDAAERFGISVEDREQHFADDHRTDGSKALTSLANFRFLEQVVPKRRLAGPSELAETDVVAQERLLAYEPRHCFAGGQPGSDAPLQISHRKRLEVLIIELAGDVHWQLEECLGQAPVDGA